MTLEELKPHWKSLEDAELLTLLMEISDEVKRRNTIMKGILGTAPPEVQRETIQKGFQTLLEAMANKPKGGSSPK
jgi:hypothetical protein